MFNLLNTRVAVNAESRIKTWPGPTAVMIREWASKPGSPGLDVVHFGQNNRLPYSASIIASALARLIGGKQTGKLEKRLVRTDEELKKPFAIERAQAFLSLYARAFPPDGDRARLVPSVALGEVSRDRWAKMVKLPSALEIGKVARVNWEKVLRGSFAMSMLPVAVSVIQERWTR